MGDTVNLRQARKHKVAAEKQLKAAQNRAAFGFSKLEKARKTRQAEQARKHLDGHKRERDE